MERSVVVGAAVLMHSLVILYTCGGIIDEEDGRLDSALAPVYHEAVSFCPTLALHFSEGDVVGFFKEGDTSTAAAKGGHEVLSPFSRRKFVRFNKKWWETSATWPTQKSSRIRLVVMIHELAHAVLYAKHVNNEDDIMMGFSENNHENLLDDKVFDASLRRICKK